MLFHGSRIRTFCTPRDCISSSVLLMSAVDIPMMSESAKPTVVFDSVIAADSK